jgi:hypothetical protein
MSLSEPSADSLIPAELRAWLLRVLQKYGMFAVDAELVVSRLVEGERRGWPGAGLALLGELVTAFEMGDIDPRARTLKPLDLPAFAVMDGGTGVGQVTASRAMTLAIEKSRTTGLAAVVVRNTQPLGDPRVYAELAAREGCLGFCTTNAGKAWHAAGADAAWLSSHPQAWGWPGDAGTAWVAGRALSSEDAGPIAAWQGAISLALTAGLTGSRLPAAKKKASPYGAGAEHFCLAIHLPTVQASGWTGWTTETLPRASTVWESVSTSPPTTPLELSDDTRATLQEVATQTRIALPAPA